MQVGTPPAAWNAGVFSLIRQLSETVILPIAGLVLTFVATYELIQMLLERNDMHDFDFSFLLSIDKRQIDELATMRFLENGENVVFLGPPSVGKTQ